MSRIPVFSRGSGRLEQSLEFYADNALREAKTALASAHDVGIKAGAFGGSGHAIIAAQAVEKAIKSVWPSMLNAYTDERSRLWVSNDRLDGTVLTAVDSMIQDAETLLPPNSGLWGLDSRIYQQELADFKSRLYAAAAEHFRRPGVKSFPDRHPRVFGVVAFIAGLLATEAFSRLVSEFEKIIQ